MALDALTYEQKQAVKRRELIESTEKKLRRAEDRLAKLREKLQAHNDASDAAANELAEDIYAWEQETTRLQAVVRDMRTPPSA